MFHFSWRGGEEITVSLLMWAQYQALNKPVRLHGEDRGRTSSPHARTFNLINQKRLLKTFGGQIL